MAAGSTYTPIATYTVSSSGSVSSYTFSSIPSTYTDLVLIVNAAASPGPEFRMYFNTDTGTNYSRNLITGNGTTASANRGNNLTYISLNDGLSANVWTNQIVSINNYSNTTAHKITIGRSNSTSDATQAIVGLWRSTSAINSITILFDRASTFNAGSTFTLYGIAAA